MSFILNQSLPLPAPATQSYQGAITATPPYFLPPIMQIPISTFPQPMALTVGRALYIEYKAFAIDSNGGINGSGTKFYGSCMVIGGSPPTVNNNDQVLFYTGGGGPYITGTILTNGDLALSLTSGFNYDVDVMLEITSMRILGNQ
jgi:hypothetical protein